jgi:uncharacterized membrane protein
MEHEEGARFVAVVYGSYGRANDALAAVEELDLVDAAVVVKDPGGRLELHQTRGASIGEGAIAGGTVGLLAGLLFGLPVGVAFVGLVAGGGWGSRDTGIPDDRLRKLGRELEPEQAVLCVLVEPAVLPRLREQLVPYAGDAVEVDVSPAP